MSSERVQVAVRLRTFVSAEERESGLAWQVCSPGHVEELLDDALFGRGGGGADIVGDDTGGGNSARTTPTGTPTKKQRAWSLGGHAQFAFDHVYAEEAPTKQVYDEAVRYIIEGALDGFNGTIFAYGQTASGKTFTMIGTPESPVRERDCSGLRVGGMG
jgi:hypothetical protein